THRVETAAELLVPLLLELAYFGVLEGIWGCSLGKRLCRLRVGLARDNCPPGLGRATLRAAVVYFLFDLGDLSSRILYAVLLPGIADDWDGLSQAQKLVAFAINLSFIGSTLLGIGLIAYTMRKRNGYRGLHELLSGTRTYRLHSPRTRRSLGASVSEFQLELLPMLGLPEKIGAYQIEGSLYCTANELVLRALDPLLRRTVWLWLRPATAPAVNEGRRMTSRATRARWLACGTTADKQWDAFLAP